MTFSQQVKTVENYNTKRVAVCNYMNRVGEGMRWSGLFLLNRSGHASGGFTGL